MLFNVDIVNPLLKKSNGETHNASFYLFGLECSGCQGIGGGDLEQKVLFRAG